VLGRIEGYGIGWETAAVAFVRDDKIERRAMVAEEFAVSMQLGAAGCRCII
jgi:hypothetical protein